MNKPCACKHCRKHADVYYKKIPLCAKHWEIVMTPEDPEESLKLLDELLSAASKKAYLDPDSPREARP